MIPFTADLLNSTGWDGGPLTRPAWAVILYGAACAIVTWAYQRLRQPFYLLPLVWALFGYTLRFDGDLRVVAAVLASGLFLYFLSQVVSFYRRRERVLA